MSDEEKPRTASCVCGGLEVECRGEPVSVSLCHCLDCQRRTGSAFGIAAFYRRGDVLHRGEAATYTRRAESGHEFSFRFCPNCGTTVYWETGLKPDLVVVAVGAFADPGFPAPARAHYAEHRHPWLDYSV